MILTLEITGPQAGSIAGAPRKVFDAAGGTIGRLPDNHWMLPDPHVSGHHAVIRYIGGTFYIEDTSTNGVFINSTENRLTRGQPYALKSGDRILIDLYEIRASITPESKDVTAGPFADDPFGPVNVPASFPPLRQEAPPYGGVLPVEDVDPINLLGLEPPRLKPSTPAPAHLSIDSVLSEHYQVPVSVPLAPTPSPQVHQGMIPANYDPLATDDRPPAPPIQVSRSATLTPPPSVRANPGEVRKAEPARVPEVPLPHAPGGTDANIDLSAMLAAAGVDPGTVTPELARTFGQIIRVVVSGMMDVLQARQETKEEFRMGMTRFKRADNNPLKFSANVDDALHNLLVKRNAAYLGPVDAFEDAFEDLRNHQMATLAGMRVAFEAMLAQFDPERLQAQFDRGVKPGSLRGVLGRLRYWSLYQERFDDMVRDQEASFRRLFGDQFAEAYEEQLKRLKAQGRPRTR
jgi:type VI secretion system FHA domain protein